MRIVVTGASGFIGQALVPRLRQENHQVLRLVRRPPTEKDEVYWDAATAHWDADQLDGIDGVVHLAGENLASGRWNSQRMARIRESRTDPTFFLSRSLAALPQLPKVLISASAVGYYGHRGAESLTEASAPGQGFLAELCQVWEDSTAPARVAGIRVVVARFGIVLGPGGALAKMLLPFKLGLGGRIGPGNQYMSWVSREDAVRAILHLLRDDSLEGPVNVVAPGAVTNREFTKALGAALSRPTILPLPAALARMAFGPMADEMLLSSTRVQPVRLQEAGFEFRHPDIETAMAFALEKRARRQT
ncbi:MAG: TIGR01777 family protein [Candidatus Marinimicrobia bacterium]|nr:TIGR01777 family protein [Candidatus Neomarinimicrobiota bacterium]